MLDEVKATLTLNHLAFKFKLQEFPKKNSGYPDKLPVLRTTLVTERYKRTGTHNLYITVASPENEREKVHKDIRILEWECKYRLHLHEKRKINIKGKELSMYKTNKTKRDPDQSD